MSYFYRNRAKVSRSTVWNFYGRTITIVSPLFAILLITGITAYHLLQFSHVEAAGPVVLHGTFAPLLKQSHLLERANPRQQISLSIGLRSPREANLNAYLRDIMRPGTHSFHHFLSPGQYSRLFSPTWTTYNALLRFLQTQGFTITDTYSHRQLIAFRGTIAQAERAFHVVINIYRGTHGQLFYANDREPTLPAQFARQVLSINGLDDAIRWHHAPMYKHSIPKAAHNNAPESVSCPGHGSTYLLPDQTAAAYNLQPLYNNHIQGEGQTIALFELNTYQPTDLTAYASCFSQRHTAIEAIPAGALPVPTDAGLAEVELDAEVVLSAAPALGNLKIYEAANDVNSAIAEWARIIQDAPPIVSTSWGLCEQDTSTMLIQQENALFKIALAQGQSIFSASGDSGSTGCAFDFGGSTTLLNAGDPGAQPYVTSVGGTTLTLNGSSYGKEVVWNSPPNPSLGYSGGSAGGGISQYWAAPSWQDAPGVHNSYSTGTLCKAPAGSICRETPDVALHADPHKGYLIYCTPLEAGCNSGNPWFAVGGTSAAAPIWASFAALVNQWSVKQGGANIGFINPLLYQLARDANSYSRDFHDITEGNNDFNNTNNGVYPATTGYDLASGLGSFNAANLAQDLVNLILKRLGTRQAAVSNTWYFAEGSVGGGFSEFITLQNTSPTHNSVVDITYLFENKQPVVVTHTVEQSSRLTVSANNDLHVNVNDRQQSLAAIVAVRAGNPGVVAERPMYFNYKGIKSGSAVMGSTSPGRSYYFAAADTRQNGRAYYTYITILNADEQNTASVRVTYYTGACGLVGQKSCPTQNVTVPPRRRATVSPAALSLRQRLSVMVQASSPVIVERPLYVNDTVPTAGGHITGAASQIGVNNPDKRWLFAEGYTGKNFQEYLILANFATNPTTTQIKLTYDNGHAQTVQVTVRGLSQTYVDVNQLNNKKPGNCDISPCQVSASSSAEVTSNSPIVAARLQYFHFGSGKYAGITDTLGEPSSTPHTIYSFAEGYTGNGFQEYLTVQNPTDHDETVAITLYSGTNTMQQQASVKAHSRQTFDINTWLVPIARASSGSGGSYDNAAVAQVLDAGGQILVERAIYFNYRESQGGSDVIGFTAN
jgi:Pro-kumamolisin, activation domain